MGGSPGALVKARHQAARAPSRGASLTWARDKADGIVCRGGSPPQDLRGPGPESKDKLTRQAVREGWGTGRLQLAVQAERGGRRPHVGRKPRVPEDPAERLLALDAQCEKLWRWCDAALPDLPADLHPLIASATKAVRRVQQAVAARLQDADRDEQ